MDTKKGTKVKKNKWKYIDGDGNIVITDGVDIDRGMYVRPKKIINKNTNKIKLQLSLFGVHSNRKPLVTIDVRMKDLAKDIYTLRDYGIILQIYESMSIAKTIEENFYKPCFETEEIDGVGIGENELVDFSMLLDAIAYHLITVEAEVESIKNRRLYLIKVDDFAKIFVKSEYKHVDLVELRKKLKEDGFIHFNKGKTDYLVKNVRHVAMYENKIKSVIKRLKEEESAVADSINEEVTEAE